MKTKIIRLLLSAVLMMCCTMMYAEIKPTQPQTDGNGNYVLSTAAELYWFANYVNSVNTSAKAILTEDITVNSNVLNSDGSLNSGTFETWTPIGNSSKLYAGTFNGNGHTISGLYFNDQDQSKIGLFGMTTTGAHIHNLGVKDSYFNGKDHVGGICGDFMNGLIENCWSEVVVYVTTGDGGGLTGSVFTNAVLKDCYTICSVAGSGSRGLVCGAQTGTIENCYARQINSTGTTIAIGWTDSKAPTATNVEIKSQDAFASGEVCHLLNGEKIDTKWRQQIGTDSYPVWTGNYLVNYYNGSSSYYYNETMCEHSENLIHNFEAATLTRCNNSKFTYWHCTHCGKNYSYEGEGGHANQTKELSAREIGTHSLEWVQAVLPTSSTTGRYEYWHCSICDKNFFDEQCTIEATDAALTVPVAKNNEIWYTTTDNKKLTPNMTHFFGAAYNDADNVYEKGLGKITFDTEVTIIGQQAFMDCSRLTNIELPNSVKEIGIQAFYDCSNLITAPLKEGVSNIGNFAFSNCSKLQSVTIPGSVKSMGNYVLSGCTSLSKVTIEDGAYIGDNTFQNYTGTLTINGSLSGVGIVAFNGCTGLNSVSVKGGSIGQQAFKNCTKLITATLQEGVTSIGIYAFDGCSQLQSITISGSVKSMGNYVFSGCTSLNNVTIEDGAYIGNYVFQNYTGSLTINGSLSGVGQSAFEDCTGLNSVSVKGGSIGQQSFQNCTNLSTATLDGVTSIEHHAFRGCSQLQSITIPGSVKSMGNYVFSGCKSLNNVTIEDGAYIGDNTFQNYTGSLTINGSLSGVDQSAFEGCTGLNSVSVKGGSIGQQAFQNCTNLSTATIDGVTSIGNSAFNGCSQLQSITIPGSVKSMGNDVFGNCNSLKNVTIEDGAYIGMRVFQNYKGTLTINGSLSGVGNSAFYGCTGLTSVSVKSGSIEIYAFASCTGLTSVSLLEGVTSIYGYAFQNCSNLKDIFVKWTEAEKIPTVKNAFDNIDQSKVTLHVPTNTTSLYQTKDIWKYFRIVEDVNFIITKTDDTTIKQQVVANGGVTIDERNRNIKSLEVSEEVEKVRVTYYRNFANAGKWQAWYVPFDVDVEDMAQAGLNVAEIYGILLDKDNKAVIAFLKMDAGTVKANTPYVVRPKWYGDVTVTTTTTLYPTKATQFAINSAKDTYTFGGIYEQTTTPGNWYAVNTSGQFQKMGTGVNLQPMRIWMTIDPRDDNPYTQPTEANAKMDIMVVGDDAPTGITSYENENENENDNDNGVIYNLNGQRVTNIQKGQVYIMNGKKYIAK